MKISNTNINNQSFGINCKGVVLGEILTACEKIPRDVRRSATKLLPQTGSQCTTLEKCQFLKNTSNDICVLNYKIKTPSFSFKKTSNINITDKNANHYETLLISNVDVVEKEFITKTLQNRASWGKLNDAKKELIENFPSQTTFIKKISEQNKRLNADNKDTSKTILICEHIIAFVKKLFSK